MSRRAVLNYHHAELLFHVLRSRTLTEAAKAMHVSQPAVTKQLRALEESLGVELFKKESGRLTPTTEAMLLVEEVERTRASLVSLNELAVKLRTGVAGKLVVCAIPALAQALLPTTLERFRQLHPEISIEIKVENSWRIMDLAETQQIDIGICHPSREMQQVDCPFLIEIKMICIVRKEDAFAEKKKLLLSDLRGRPIVMLEIWNTNAVVQSALAASGLDRDIVCSVSTSTLACEIVLSTGSIGLIDSLTAVTYRSRGIEIVEMPELPRRRISLLRPKLRSPSRASDTFAKLLNEVADSLSYLSGTYVGGDRSMQFYDFDQNSEK